MIEKFTFQIHSPKIEKKLILVKTDTELRSHVVMKLFSYVLFYDPRLQIDIDVGMHYRPDLVVMGDSGVPELWIDCGHIAKRKTESLAKKFRRTRFIVVKAVPHELKEFKRMVADKVEFGERLEYLSFDEGFVAGVAAAIGRLNDFTLYEVTENVIGVALNDQIFESSLRH